MATDAVNLPQGFVLDEQQKSQQGLPQGFVVDQGSFGEGEIITSELDVEGERERRSREEDKRMKLSGLELARNPIDPNVLKSADDFDLLEGVNKSRLFKDRANRRVLYNELKTRGFPDEFIDSYVKLDDPTGFVESITDPRNVAKGAGGIAGSVIGARLGGPEAAKKGAIIGAAAGAGLADLGTEAFSRAFQPEQRRPPLELAKDTAMTAATEAFGEAGGRYLIDPALGLISRKFAGEVIEDAPRLSKELAKAGRQIQDAPQFLGKDIPVQDAPTAVGRFGQALKGRVSAELTPGQQTAGRTLELVEDAMRSTFLGGSRITKTKDIVQPAALRQFVSNKMGDLTSEMVNKLDLESLGSLMQDTIHGSKVPGVETRGASGAYRAISSQLYKETDKAIGTQAVDMTSLKRSAGDILDRISKGKQFAPDEAVNKYIGRIQNLSDNMSFEDAIQVRSDLLEVSRKLEAGGSAKAESLGKSFASIVDNEMESAARKAGPEAHSRWRQANMFFKEGQDRFNSEIIQKVTSKHVRQNPELVLRSIFGSSAEETSGALSKMKNVKQVLLSNVGKNPVEIEAGKETWDQLRFNWLGSKLKSASDIDGVLQGKKFAKLLDDTGDNIMSEMFSPEEMAGINDMATLARLVQTKGESLGPVFSSALRVGQVGGAGGAAFQGKKLVALSLIGGPAVISRFITSPAGRRILTTGIKSEGTSGITGQIIAGVIKMNKEDQEQLKRIQDMQKQLDWQRNQPEVSELRGFGGRGF